MMLCFCGCSFKKNEAPVTKSGIYFDTIVSITVYDEDASEMIDQCFSICDHYEKLYSKTIEDSDISRINKAEGKPTVVEEETIELIEKGIYFGELSEGLFDITIGPVADLWDFHNNNTNNIPDKKAIDEAIKHVSYKNIKIDKNDSTVTLIDSESQIDLGGIAKGYIADKLKQYLVSQGINSALINLGGNIEAVGNKPDGRLFNIGIKKPFSENEIESTVELKNNSVSTSGVYERYFYNNDELYHHIINPKTGYPVKTDLFGVSVICDSSTDADALGTICILMGYERAKEFMNSRKDCKVIWSFAE